MTSWQTGFIISLIVLSVILFWVPSLLIIIRKLFVNTSCRDSKRSGMGQVLVLSAFFIASVWCLRYAVGYFAIIASDAATLTMTWGEEVFNSMVHTLQTFSMDEDYSEYIINGKLMLRELLGENTAWQTFYGLHASILNFAAPVAGGAIIFEILASIFPKIRLRFSYFAFWREKYYFSELNSASLALAKSIYEVRTPSFKRPVIIFTDAYVDGESEKSTELLLGAKAIGAICVRDDLSHVKKNKYGMRKFFLIDEAESGNLRTMTELASSGNSVYLKKTEIYLFTDNDTYIQVENRIRDRLGDGKKDKADKDNEDFPVFVPVQSYRNLIMDLLVDIPLYAPLVGKEKGDDGQQDLTVTVLGTGQIGMEMILSTYWIGQILNYRLNINVISQESEEEFWNKIDYINPEIRHTTIEGDPILQVNRKGDMAPVYCNVNYLQCDVRSSKFIGYLTDEASDILKTDYFLVALGTDDDNISVANTVCRYIGQYHISAKNNIRTVIAYVVYSPELSETLNGKKHLSFGKKGDVDVYMRAIGSLRDVYSVQNVFMKKHDPSVKMAREAYASAQGREQRARSYNARKDDNYKYRSNLARGMHIGYVMFSMGLIKASLFDYPDSSDMYARELEETYKRYNAIVSGQIEFQSLNEEDEHRALLHKLAWLEKRRWNAFMRINGFRHTNAYDKYADAEQKGSYKQMDIKLHPCLVECDQKGIRAKMSAKGEIDMDDVLKCTDDSDFDFLDDLSYALHKDNYNDYDFKLYDYPHPV